MSITNIIQDTEKIISSVKETIEKTDSLVKENVKFNKILTQNIEKNKPKRNRCRRPA